MKYFEVRKEVLSGSTKQYNVLMDGAHAGTSESEGEMRELTTGFSVWEYNEEGETENVEFYPVRTDMEDFTNDENEVLNKIIKEHDPSDWQNHDW